MQRVPEKDVDRAIRVIAWDMLASDADAMTAPLIIEGKEVTLVMSLHPTSQVQNFLDSMSEEESPAGTLGPNTLASPPSQVSPDPGCQSWLTQGKKGIS